MSGTLRSLPDFAPMVVRRMTGLPCNVVPLVPPERSYSSTWSRTHWVGLGSYSPERGMPPANTTCWYVARAGRLPTHRLARPSAAFRARTPDRRGRVEVQQHTPTPLLMVREG